VNKYTYTGGNPKVWFPVSKGLSSASLNSLAVLALHLQNVHIAHTLRYQTGGGRITGRSNDLRAQSWISGVKVGQQLSNQVVRYHLGL
jgi:hypothetical protein